MPAEYYRKKTKKGFKKRHVKIVKIFLKKKKTNSEKRPTIGIKTFLKIKKKKAPILS